MIRSLIVVAVLGLMLAGCQSIVGALVLPKEGIRPSEYRVQTKRDAAITTSDGVHLVANIYRPDDVPPH